MSMAGRISGKDKFSVVYDRPRKTEREREELSVEGVRISVDSLFQRKGAVKVEDLLLIRREEGLDGRVRETAEEDLVLRRSLRRYEG